MPNEFQRVMDSLLKNIPFTNCYIDDILVASRGSLEEHKSIEYKILSILDNNNMAVKWGKSAFFKSDFEWLGFKISGDGVRPLVGKADAIKILPTPKNISELRSFFGSINQYVKFVPNLSTLSSPLRPLLNKILVYKWDTSHSRAFEKLKTEIVNITENSHFDIKEKTRLKTDASHNGLVATLEQLQDDQWKTIAFASRFLNNHKIKYSTNKLELLGVVWATEHFRNYMYGMEFQIVTDHKAILSAFSANHGNKTMHCRLTRWVNRLLPFNFKISHLPGKDMGLTDLLSRLPSGKALPISHYDDEFVVASIDKIQNILLTKQYSKIVTVISVNIPAVAVNTNTRVNTIPSENEKSSDVIGQNRLNSSLALLNLNIIAAIIFCIAQSIKFCHNQHSWTEICTTICQPVDNLKFNFKSITFSDKVLLHFLILNRHFIPSSKKQPELPMDKVNETLLIIPEEHNIALKFRDDRLPPDHADLLRRYKAELNLPNSPIRPEDHCSKKLPQIMTREDKVLWDLIETIKKNQPMGIHGTYMKN